MNNSSQIITRRVRFSAAHRLYDKQLSKKENQTLFGKCCNIHGHNFDCFISIKGIVNSQTNMIINVHKINDIAKTCFVDEFDHSYLNKDIKEFQTLLPTIENLCIVIWTRLKPFFKDTLHEIKVVETENIFATYTESN